MMTLAILLGYGLPACTGWALLRLLEGKNPVLLRAERWVLGFLAGTVISLFLTAFLAVTVSLPLTRIGFLAVQLPLLAILLLTVRVRLGTFRPAATSLSLPRPSRPLPYALKVGVGMLVAWTLVKLFVGGTWFLLTPPGFDDTVKNWNLRGKIFSVTHTLGTTAPGSSVDLVGELHSYPPTVSLFKAWLAALEGQWQEGLVDSPHFVWFLCALLLVYFFLRRSVSAHWALLGSYLLSSLPLYFIHGTQAYADVFLSVHLLAAAGLLSCALRSVTPAQRQSFLRLCLLFLALLPLTKNEALVLYLPVLLAGLLGSFLVLRRHGLLTAAQLRRLLLGASLAFALFAGPWLAYKFSLGLSFGNAKSLSGIGLSWEPRALYAIALNLLFQGNWLLLVPLLAASLLLARHRLLVPSLLSLVWFVVGAFAVQLLVFSGTGLASEALYQTGYSRGIVHLAPVAVMLLVLLMHRLIQRAP